MSPCTEPNLTMNGAKASALLQPGLLSILQPYKHLYESVRYYLLSCLSEGGKKEHEKEIELYGIYVERIIHESELFWNRFKILLGLNTGLIAVFGFIFAPDVAEFLNIKSYLSCIVLCISIAGVIFSFFWLLVNLNGKKWILLMNRVIINVEKKMFNNLDEALYFQIKKNYDESYKLDVMNISIVISLIFFLLWSGLMISSLIFNYNYMIPTYSV